MITFFEELLLWLNHLPLQELVNLVILLLLFLLLLLGSRRHYCFKGQLQLNVAVVLVLVEEELKLLTLLQFWPDI